MNLRELRIAPENEIAFETYIVDLPSLPGGEALVMKFIGTYGYGAGGNGDARYMVAMTRAAIEFCEPDALIFDLSELRYEWGDMLEAVFSIGYELWGVEHVPHAAVVSDLCEPSVRSLLSDGMLLEELDFLQHDLEGALNHVDRIAMWRQVELLAR